jgi:hypothetical protein
MTSNGKPQFVKQVFSLQSNGAAEEAVDASVVQDKDRAKRDHPATPQPASVNFVSRSEGTNPKSARSHSPLVHKSRTEHLNVWINPIAKAKLQRLAEQEGLSLSATTAAFLERSLQEQVDLAYSALLEPIIKSAIQKAMRARDARLAWLLVRVAFDAEQTRSLVANILGRQQGMTEETLKNILAMSQRTAKGNITRKTPQLEELMEAVEKWLAEDEEKEANN